MNHTIKITGVYALPEYKGHKDVITKINWEITFERDGFTSLSGGETVLDIENITEFIPASQVTEAQLVSWVLAKEGGNAFITMLEGIHSTVIDSKELSSKTTALSLPFVQPPTTAPATPAAPITYNIEQI